MFGQPRGPNPSPSLSVLLETLHIRLIHQFPRISHQLQDIRGELSWYQSHSALTPIDDLQLHNHRVGWDLDGQRQSAPNASA